MTDEPVGGFDRFGGSESYGFTYSGEAYEWFLAHCDKLEGLCCEISTVDGKTIDVEMIGGDYQAGWGDAVLVKLWNEEDGNGSGDTFSLRVRNVHVY